MRHGEDSQVGAPRFHDGGTVDEDGEDFPAERQESRRGGQGDASRQTERVAVAFPDALEIPRSVVLAGEGRQGGREAGRRHPRDGLDLAAHALHGYADVAPFGGDGGERDGERGENPVLQAYRQPEEGDAPHEPALRAGEESQFPDGGLADVKVPKEDGEHHELGEAGGDGRAGGAHGGNEAPAVNQQRVERDVAHQSRRDDFQRGAAVALPVVESAVRVVVKGEEQSRTNQAHVLRGEVGDVLVEVENAHQPRRGGVYEKRVAQGHDGRQLGGLVGVDPGPDRRTGPERLRDGHLRSHFARERKGVAYPREKAGHADGGHALAAEPPQPNHVRHAVGHLHERGGDQGKCHPPNAAADVALCQVVCFCHVLFFTARNYKPFGNYLYFCLCSKIE